MLVHEDVSKIDVDTIKEIHRYLVETDVAYKLLISGIQEKDEKKALTALLSYALYLRDGKHDLNIEEKIRKLFEGVDLNFVVKLIFYMLDLHSKDDIEKDFVSLTLDFFNKVYKRYDFDLTKTFMQEIVKLDKEDKRRILDSFFSLIELYELLYLNRIPINEADIESMEKILASLWKVDRESWVRLFCYSVNTGAMFLLSGFRYQLRKRRNKKDIYSLLQEPYREIAKRLVKNYIRYGNTTIYNPRIDDIYFREIRPLLKNYIENVGKRCGMRDVSFNQNLHNLYIVLDLGDSFLVVDFDRKYFMSKETSIGKIFHRELSALSRFGENITSVLKKDPVLKMYNFKIGIRFLDQNDIVIKLEGSYGKVVVKKMVSITVFYGKVNILLRLDRKELDNMSRERLEEMFAPNSSEKEWREEFEEIKNKHKITIISTDREEIWWHGKIDDADARAIRRWICVLKFLSTKKWRYPISFNMSISNQSGVYINLTKFLHFEGMDK